MPERLNRLVDESRNLTMSEAEKEEQRLSFAFGNTAFENPLITREMVKREARRLPGKKPVTNPLNDPSRRHSIAEAPELIDNPLSKAEAEARNGLRQFDLGIDLVEKALRRGSEFRWRPSIIQALHREALQGISEFAGNWRPAGVAIEGSQHEPVAAHIVPEKIEELCDYLNDHMTDKSAVHLSAYAMWN